jgi:hypothetical protein
VLLQISNTDTLDSLSNIGGESSNYGLFFLIGFILIGVIAFFLLRKPSNKGITETKVFQPKIPPQQTKLVSDKKHDITNQLTTVIKTDIKQPINKESEIKQETIKKVIEPKPQITNKQENISVKVIETIQPEKEEHSKEKYIGYNPINIFLQTEPLTYPYVLMPKPNSVIKFPRKGRSGRKGYKEEKFKLYIEKYFKNDYQIFDDRFILVKDSAKPFEPDFTLIDEKNGINIFLDVEIDEPYEGLNDIPKRKPTHYQQSDINRNNAFKIRGWIVIRFAEIQIHQEPDSCCKFIADVLKSINPKYVLSDTLIKLKKINPLPQWTKEEAEKWSKEKYREKYLGIDSFGLTISEVEQIGIDETELGDKIEKQVKDDIFIPAEIKVKPPIAKLDKIYSAINSNKYLSCKIGNEKTIIKPLRVSENELTAFCYVKNRERTFSIYELNNLEIKDSYYTLRVAGPTIGLDQITNAVNTAITYHKLIRMKYTRSSWTNMVVDEETGELLIDRIEAEESIRTINDVQLSINALAQEHIEAYNLDSNYITAYCNKREEKRTFRFDRIGEIEILNL